MKSGPEMEQVYSQRKRYVRKKWRKKDKWGSIRYKQANNIYIYIVPKSRIKLRAHYAPEPAWGTMLEVSHHDMSVKLTETSFICINRSHWMLCYVPQCLTVLRPLTDHNYPTLVLVNLHKYQYLFWCCINFCYFANCRHQVCGVMPNHFLWPFVDSTDFCHSHFFWAYTLILVLALLFSVFWFCALD